MFQQSNCNIHLPSLFVGLAFLSIPVALGTILFAGGYLSSLSRIEFSVFLPLGLAVGVVMVIYSLVACWLAIERISRSRRRQQNLRVSSQQEERFPALRN